jgi:hypothetical protein
MAKNVAPARGSRAPSQSESFAANYATTDLTTRSGKPAHAAQLVDVRNTGATVQNAVVILQDGTTLTVPLAPSQTYPIEAPVDTLDATSGADVSAVAYWFHAGSIPFNA